MQEMMFVNLKGCRFFCLIFLLLLLIHECHSYPITSGEQKSDFNKAITSEDYQTWRIAESVLVSAALMMCAVVTTVVCLCCKIKRTFSPSAAHHNGFHTPDREQDGRGTAGVTEFTIFPPIGGHELVDQRRADEDVKFEPLPDIHPRKHANKAATNRKPRPATFSNVVSKGLSFQDWFDDPYSNFPRTQLQYVRELGSGWFGQVVEGEAYNIVSKQRNVKVVVKILMEGANTSDQMYFLHEVKPFRDLDHPNVLKLLGKCLETDPFLIILEYCAFKDLKSYLIRHRTEAESLFQQDILLRMACDVAAGVQYIHRHGFVLTDLAARNCVVSSELTVKIGDYGNSIELYKEDYYCAGGIAVPVRWCAPETLRCTETIMETREVTREANVWSFGVLLWEILEFGKLPYLELNDDELIQKVIVEKTETLKKPLTPCNHVDRLYQIIQLCQSDAKSRPLMEHVERMLNYLHSHKPSDVNASEEFELRWSQLKPRHSPSISGSNDLLDASCSPVSTSSLPGHSDFHLMREMSGSPHPSLGYDSDFSHPVISPSLQNLRGSLDDLKVDSDQADVHHPPHKSNLSAVSAESLPSDSSVTWSKSGLDASSHWTAVSRSSEHDKEVSPFTREVQEVIRKLDEDLERECPSSSEGISEDATTRAGYTILSDYQGPNSLYSEVDCDSFEPDSLTNIECDDHGRSTEQYDGGTSSDNGDEEDLSWRKIVESSSEEPGKITRIIREKSQSVQDFLKLTVIDSESGSDSDGNTNTKKGSGEESPEVDLGSAQVCHTIEKSTGGEEEDAAGNGREIVPDGANVADVIANDAVVVIGDGLENVHAQADVPDTLSPRNLVHDTGEQVSPSPPILSLGTVCTEPGFGLPSAFDCNQLVLDANLQTSSSPSPTQEVRECNSPTAVSCTNMLLVSVTPPQNDDGAQGGQGKNVEEHITDDNLTSSTSGSDNLPRIVVDDVSDPPLQDPPSLQEETTIAYRPRFGLNFRFVFRDQYDDNLLVGKVMATENVVDTSEVPVETAEITVDKKADPNATFSLPSLESQWHRTSTPRTNHADSNNSNVSIAPEVSMKIDCELESDVSVPDSDPSSPFVEPVISICERTSSENYQTAVEATLVPKTLLANRAFNISDLFVTVPESPLIDLTEDNSVSSKDDDVNTCQRPSPIPETLEFDVTVGNPSLPPQAIIPVKEACSEDGCASVELFSDSPTPEPEISLCATSPPQSSTCVENHCSFTSDSGEATVELELSSDSKPLTLSDLLSDEELSTSGRSCEDGNDVSIKKEPEMRESNSEGKICCHQQEDVDVVSLDEGFEQSDDDDRTVELSDFKDSASVGDECFGESTSSSESHSPTSKSDDDDHQAAKQQNSDQSSNSEDCFILVDLETNEAILVDRAESDRFGGISRVDDGLSISSSVVHPLSTLNTGDDASGTGASSPSGWEYEGDNLDVRTMPSTDASCDLSQSSTCSDQDTDPSQDAPQISTGDGSDDLDDVEETSSSSFELISADEPLARSVPDDFAADSLPKSSLKPQEMVHSVDYQSSSSSVGLELSVSPPKCAVDVDMIIDQDNILQFEPSAELLLLMEASAKIEKLVVDKEGGKSRMTEDECEEKVNVNAQKSPSPSAKRKDYDDDDNGSWTVGCIPPTSSPTCEGNVPGTETPSSLWETSADALSSSSSCQSPSSTSSTSGEFDCSKEFRYEAFRTVEGNGPSGDVQIEEAKEEEDDDDDDDDDDDGDYGDDEDDDDGTEEIEFKASIWDKDATPTKSLLKSPDKHYLGEGKKTVSFKLQKRSVIYEYPREEEDEDELDYYKIQQQQRAMWGQHFYDPRLDYSSYTDWELGDEEFPEDGVVEVDGFEDCEEEEDSSGSFDVRQPDPARVALYTLSSTADDDLTLEYSSDGSGAGGPFYGDAETFDFASYLSHYSNPQFYPGVDTSGQQTSDENFWLRSILGSEDFFVSSSDCPFDFGTQMGSEMPSWLTSSQVYGAYTEEGENGQVEGVEGQDVEQEQEEEQDEVDGRLGYYEREGHVSRMGDYGDGSATWENEVEEEEGGDGDSQVNGEELDDEEEEADSAESAESDQQVAMETDSTDDNLDEIGCPSSKADNVPNGNVDVNQSSPLVNCNNFSHLQQHQKLDIVVSPLQTNGLVETGTEWKSSSVTREPSTGNNRIANLGGSRVESAA